MGVAYKLRQDIVDFIVQSKKSDDSLSCRKLVGIIKERFSVEVSKSSVNAVIKEFDLSGPVGRHSISKAPKNFSIPKFKKDILRQSVRPFLASSQENDPIPVLPAETQPPVESDTVGSTMPAENIDSESSHDIRIDADVPMVYPVEVEVEVQGSPDDCSLALPPDPVKGLDPKTVDAVSDAFAQACCNIAKAEEQKRQKALSPVWSGDMGELYPRLGASVLWYVFKAACASSRLGEALERVLEPLPEGVTASQCEALFFSSFFASQQPGAEKDDLRTLWRLSGLKDADGRMLMDRLINHDNDRVLCIGVRTGLSMAFTPVRYYRLLTKKGARFYIDSASFVLHQEFIDAGQAAVLPIFIAVERAVDRLITNIVPSVIDVPCGGVSSGLLDFIRVMEGFGDDVLTSVELIGDDDRKCVEFAAVPLIRRSFILRVKLGAADIERVEYEVLGNKKLFYDEVSGLSGSFIEGSYAVEGISRPIRVFSVKLDQGGECVLLTNIFGVTLKTEDIIRQYFSSESANFMGDNHANYNKNSNINPQVTSLSEVYREIDLLAQKFIMSPSAGNHLSWQDICRILYNLPGYVKETSRAVFIKLQLPEEFYEKETLSFLIRKINNAALKSQDGRRLIFSY